MSRTSRQTFVARLISASVIGVCLLAACSRSSSSRRLQGYIEGEFVYVASPLAGSLQKLAVQRGAEVKAGDLLFLLDETPEKAAREEEIGRAHV